MILFAYQAQKENKESTKERKNIYPSRRSLDSCIPYILIRLLTWLGSSSIATPLNKVK